MGAQGGCKRIIESFCENSNSKKNLGGGMVGSGVGLGGSG